VKNAVGEAALSASRSNTFLGARYQRFVKRRGRKRALVAVGLSLLVIVWHLPLILASAPPFRAGVKAILGPGARSAGVLCVFGVTVRRDAAGFRCTA
jgi:hypothetical protein